MHAQDFVHKGARLATGALAFAGAAYAAHTAYTWLRYGHVGRLDAGERDLLLDSFMPQYDIVDRMQREILAPPEVTLAAAEAQDLMSAPGVNIIFRARQFAMGAGLETKELPKPLIEQMKALGWVELRRVPGREIVMGAVTEPWKGNVTFRSVPPGEFAAFAEPGCVKIAWTLRADPLGRDRSLFRTETRAIATDDEARARFRNYWSLVAPGVWLIRRLSAFPMAHEAERQAAATAA